MDMSRAAKIKGKRIKTLTFTPVYDYRAPKRCKEREGRRSALGKSKISLRVLEVFLEGDKAYNCLKTT